MPRNLVVINFSGAFPLASREGVEALEVVRTSLKAGGVLYTDALLDSSNPYSSLADLLTPFARGSVLDRDGRPSCGSIGNARTIFHHMRSKGYASTFIGAFGIPTDGDDHDAAMRRVGVDAFSRADSFASSDPNDLKDAHVLRQAQGIMLSWSGDSNFLFVSLCGPCGVCGQSGAADAQTLPDCERHVSLVDGLLCSLMECTTAAGGSQPALIMVSASHVDVDHAPSLKETSTLRQQPVSVYASFALLTGTAPQGLRCDAPVPLREILHEALKAAASDRDPSPSLKCDAVHVAYDLSIGVLQRWNGGGAHAAETPFDYPGFHVACQAPAVSADDGACPVWVEASFSIRALVAWTMPSLAHAWDTMTVGDKVRVAASRSTWKLAVTTDAPGCAICVASACAIDATTRERAIAILASAVRECMQTIELAFRPTDLSMLLYAATRGRDLPCQADAVLHVVDELGNVLQRVCGGFSAAQLIMLAELNAALYTPDGNVVRVRVADPQLDGGVAHAARARPTPGALGGGAAGAKRDDAATCVLLHDARVDLDTIARGCRNDYYITRVALAPLATVGATDAPPSFHVSASKDSAHARADDATRPPPPPVQAARGPGASVASEHVPDAHLVGIASAHDDLHAAASSVPVRHSRRAGVGQGAGVVLNDTSGPVGQRATLPSQRWGVALRGEENGGLSPNADGNALREDRNKAATAASSSGRHATHASTIATGAVAKDSERPEPPIAGDARVVGAAKRLEKRLRRKHELR